MSNNKTEQPTPKRKREAREKGDVCKSQDIASVATVLGLTLYLYFIGPDILERLLFLVEFPMLEMHKPFNEIASTYSSIAIDTLIILVVPVVCFVMALALISNLVQVGFLYAPKAAMPKLENLDPAKWFKKTFSMKNFVEFLKNVVKVIILSLVTWYVFEKNLALLFQLETQTIYGYWNVVGSILSDLLIITTVAFGIIAVLDFLFQKWKYNKDHLMSMEEVKQEYKEMEGDPQIKSKRRELAREIATQDTMSNVRRAKVLVTNPTHFAVALEYEKGKTPLPIILAKGEGHIAKRMIKVAEEEGIPIMRNVPLARELFATGTENSYIPKNLIKPVADVLRWVQSIQK